MWRVSELKGLGGAGPREAVEPGGALERLVGKDKAGEAWGEVVRRVAQVRGGRVGVIGRTVRAGAGPMQVQQAFGCLGEISSE